MELKREEVDEVATRNTARVIKDVDADILGVVEAESRPALVRFSDNVLATVGGAPYAHAMLIDGNDERGIDVGLYAREGYDMSKGVGSQETSSAKRDRQAARVRKIYEDIRKTSEFVAVLGDLNDTPDSDPLARSSGKST